MSVRRAWVLLAIAVLSSAVVAGVAFSAQRRVLGAPVSEGFAARGEGWQRIPSADAPERDSGARSPETADRGFGGSGTAFAVAGQQKRWPSFQRHADDFARDLVAPLAPASGEKKRTMVVDAVPENFEIQTAEYVERALRAPSMYWYREGLRRSPENLRRRLGRESASLSLEVFQAYIAMYKAAVVDPGAVPPGLVSKLGRAASAARESLEAALSDASKASGASKAARRELAGLLSAPVWPWRVAVVGTGPGPGPGPEGGLPHTVHDVIVIPQEVLGTKSLEGLASLLIHEATHVFQRMRPRKAAEILKRDFAFVSEARFGANEIPYTEKRSVRVNPDTDDLRWFKVDGRDGGGGGSGGRTLLPVPVFKEGGGFGDVHLLHGEPGVLQLPAEHPKEVMAYEWQKWAK